MAEPEKSETEKTIEAQRALSALMAAVYTWHPHLEQWHSAVKRKVRPVLIKPGEYNAFTMKDLGNLSGYQMLRVFAAEVLTRYFATTHVSKGGTVFVLEMV